MEYSCDSMRRTKNFLIEEKKTKTKKLESMSTLFMCTVAHISKYILTSVYIYWNIYIMHHVK